MAKKMTPEQQAIWSLVVEIGGDQALFDVHPNLKQCWQRGIDTLTDAGVINEDGVLAEEYRT